MKGYLVSSALFAIALSLLFLLIYAYPNPPKLNDTQLYQVRLITVETVAQEHVKWSHEKQAVTVDNSMRKLKNIESWKSFIYGVGYFFAMVFLISGWMVAKSTRNSHKNRFRSLNSAEWLNHRYGEQEYY